MDSCPPEIIDLITQQLVDILESEPDYGPIQNYSLISKFFYYRIRERIFQVIEIPFVVNRNANPITTSFCELVTQNPALLEDVRDLTIDFQRNLDSCHKFDYRDKQGFKTNTLQRLAALIARSQIHTLAIQSTICCYKFPLDRSFIGDELIAALVSLRCLPTLRKLRLGNFAQVPLGMILGDPLIDALESLILCDMDLDFPQYAPLMQGYHELPKPNIARSAIPARLPVSFPNLRSLDIVKTTDVSMFSLCTNPLMDTAPVFPNLQELVLRDTVSIQATQQAVAQGFQPFLNLENIKVSFSTCDNIETSSDFRCYPNLKRFTITSSKPFSHPESCKILTSLRIPPSVRTMEMHFHCPVTMFKPFGAFVRDRFKYSHDALDDAIFNKKWAKGVALNLVFLFNTPTAEWIFGSKLLEEDREVFDDAAREAFPKSCDATHLNFRVDLAFNTPSRIF